MYSPVFLARLIEMFFDSYHVIKKIMLKFEEIYMHRNKDATLKLISSHCASIWCSTQYNNLGCYKSIESENEI